MMRSLLLPLSLMLSASFGGLIHAQPSGAVGDHFMYLVESGDTLLGLAEEYTKGSNHWTQLKDLNQVSNEYALPIGKEIKIPFDMIPVVATEAVITHSIGEVWINDNTLNKAQALKAGDTIRTGKNGFVTLQLADQSTLSLPNNSQLYIKQLNAFERTQLIDAILELKQGSVESQVVPDTSQNRGVGRFEIQTPVSITGVRGTDFRVHAHEQAARTELLSGRAHLNTAQADHETLLTAQGATVNAAGDYAILPLLPAPNLSEPIRAGSGWETTISPMENVDHYVIQIALAADGTSLVSSKEVPAPDQGEPLTVSLMPSGAGDHYAFIRGVDHNGLMGMDASLSFPGQAVLISRDGSPVLSSNKQAVLLKIY